MRYKWQFKEYPWYKLKMDGKRVEIYNTRTNKRIKQTAIGTTRGYWIKSKWYSLGRINKSIELTKNIKAPF